MSDQEASNITKNELNTMEGSDGEKCSSPRPMAFTVDFTDEKDQKKLALRDSIGRFAPAKIKSKLATKEAVILVDE